MPPKRGRRAKEEVRNRVLATIQENPGISLGELHGAVGLSPNGVLYYVSGLESSGKVRSIQVGRRRCLFPAEGPSRHESGQMRAVTHGRARRSVAVALVRLGTASPEDLMAQTGLTARMVYHHLKKLRDGGAATRVRMGLVSPTDALNEFIRETNAAHSREPSPEGTSIQPVQRASEARPEPVRPAEAPHQHSC